MPDDVLTGAALPLAPDFAPRGDGPEVASVAAEGAWVAVRWTDGAAARFHAMYLRENAVGVAIDPVTRERSLDPADLPEDLAPAAASMAPSGAVVIRWVPDGAITAHHPGWLRDIAEGRWRPAASIPAQQSWDAAAMPEPVSFDGPSVLADDAALTAWITATHRFGLTRLRGLGSEAGTVGRVAERIGVVRSSSFGFLFDVESKPDPDSAAYTAAALTGHTDLPTREVQPGLQLLHCRENTCPDGWSTMVDGFRVAEAIRDTDGDAFDALTGLPWVFTNRHRKFDYRMSRPIVEAASDGTIREIRIANALRAEPDMPEAEIPRGYRAVRLFMALVRDPRFVCRYPFEAGDLVIFDNRRILHGREEFDPNGGVRRLQGCYLDRDELFSRLRVLAREAR